ncbi:tRNA (adenosine(37)-N6)-threonylcarbamoyltransferase complex dimerization subunit type 1 TsaB [Desulfosarcina ovata subsp. sediminis]|uniref:tRNA (Adenosine(37)-N6)-threonylcarbamoyltransferase complex dimerization subunit type 1 TsaB n=1 Tax=Desulfosarcina ovata subsp. sediminis TaxID=885957 RepID=A0A5K7ZH35_9BACT|nr:tRNA (adenosine(37)-N6)-threonylcarbamoyltransferase complex dimerization subunit type 1 TsaB [Desulfosarcina ovata]BBO79585.1 tRNA (adenosine(37)-N6)-threonylcarbamoyltransferase complex dimerization subunit type 1 TsaB [Desulfosarcina ovata subsp. sediminis]
MMLLAVDTATTSCSVALLRGRRLLVESVFAGGRTHSRHLMGMIDGLLGQCGLMAGDIKAIAVTRGPGTFTGLRIGISTVKGLAAAMHVPVVGVSSLAALAFPLRHYDGPVVSMIDARRGEVYHTCYDHGSYIPDKVVPVQVSAPDSPALQVPPNAILVGSGAALYRDVFKARFTDIRFADPAEDVIRAVWAGLLAMDRLERDDVDAVDRLVPQYIRKSDAQIQK